MSERLTGRNTAEMAELGAPPGRVEQTLRLLSEASAALSASLDVTATIDVIARLIVGAIADWCVIDLKEADGSGVPFIRRAAAVHHDADRQKLLDDLTRRFPPDVNRPTLAGPVIASGESLLVTKVSEDAIERLSHSPEQADLVKKLGFRSYIVAPLKARERLLGVLAVISSNRCYDGDDLAVTEELARRIGMAVDNALLFAQARASAERMARLQSVTAALAGAVSGDQVAEIIIREGVAALGALEGILCLTSDDGRWLQIVREVGLPSSTLNEWHRFSVDGPFPLSEAVRTGKPVFIENRAEAVARFPQIRDANTRAVAESWASLPLRSGGRTFGGLAFGFAQPRSFDGEERAFAATLAQQCAIALERVRLLASERAARSAAEESADRTARLQTVTANLSAAVTINDVANAVVQYGLSAAGAMGGVVCLLNASATEIDQVWALGYPQSGLEGFRRVALGIALPPRDVVQTRAPVFISSPEEWLERYLPPEQGMTVAEAAAALPLLVGEQLVGVMVLRFASRRSFSEGDRAQLMSVASQCAQALERARLHQAEHAARMEAEEARARADEANRAKTEFLAVMSHELRTPLNAIAGYAELLEIGIHGALNDSQREAIARIQRSERHLLGLINDVLNFAKIEAGHVDIDTGPVPVHETLAALEALVAPQLRAKYLEYAYKPGPSDLTMQADPEKVRQILLNLLSNAIKFSEPGGVIGVSADGEDGVVRLRVRDSGAGIPADKLDRIFEPFVQLRPGRTRTHEGTGLGLAISRDLARAMHGEIAVESTVGVGSIFTLTLPRSSQ